MKGVLRQGHLVVGQQIVTILWIASDEELGADGIKQDGVPQEATANVPSQGASDSVSGSLAPSGR